jgi:hypothetical protein
MQEYSVLYNDVLAQVIVSNQSMVGETDILRLLKRVFPLVPFVGDLQCLQYESVLGTILEYAILSCSKGPFASKDIGGIAHDKLLTRCLCSSIVITSHAIERLVAYPSVLTVAVPISTFQTTVTIPSASYQKYKL